MRGFSKLVLLCGTMILLSAADAFAQANGGVINIGAAFGWLEPYINAIVGAAIMFLVGWVLWLAKTKFNVSIDDSMRAALETFLKNQAAALIAAGKVKLDGTNIEVNSSALVAAAAAGSTLIPDTLKHFDITPAVLAAKIVAAIPQNQTVAATVATTEATAPASKETLLTKASK